MLRKPNEYRILKYFIKRGNYVVTSALARDFKLDEKLTRDIVISLRDRNLLTQSLVDVSGASTSANIINGNGVNYFNKMRRSRIEALIGAIVGILGLLFTIVQIFL
jgi:hypothetical protein